MAEETSSAILDLSYRNYDGPIGTVNMRWLVIARAMISKAFRLKSFWGLTIASGWYFIAMIVILFFTQQIAASNPMAKQGLENVINGIVWKDQFFHGFGYSQHVLLVVALLVGAGTIANDNRANALLVYLSKPSRKIDYLVGKWIGVFIPMLTVISIPTVIFYCYGLFSFRDQGFFTADPWLIVKEMAVLPAAAAIHTSLVIFISSLFKQGTVAGAVYAGIYFMGYFFSLLVVAVWKHSETLPAWVAKLNFLCVDGFITGFARSVIQPGNSMPFGIAFKNSHPIPNPAWAPYLIVVILVICLTTFGTWTRIRAVEVV